MGATVVEKLWNGKIVIWCQNHLLSPVWSKCDSIRCTFWVDELSFACEGNLIDFWFAVGINDSATSLGLFAGLECFNNSTLLGAEFNSKNMKDSIMAFRWFGCWRADWILSWKEMRNMQTQTAQTEMGTIKVTFLEGISIKTKWISLLIGDYAFKLN